MLRYRDPEHLEYLQVVDLKTSGVQFPVDVSMRQVCEKQSNATIVPQCCGLLELCSTYNKESDLGQWLWLSWQSGHFRLQRSAVRIQHWQNFIYQLHNRKDKNKEKEARKGPSLYKESDLKIVEHYQSIKVQVQSQKVVFNFLKLLCLIKILKVFFLERWIQFIFCSLKYFWIMIFFAPESHGKVIISLKL